MKRVLLLVLLLIAPVLATLDVALSDQGMNVRQKSDGELLPSGTLSVYIYDAASGGNLIYSEVFTDAIVNGSWNVMLGEDGANPLSLEYGKVYYKDYAIDGEDVTFKDNNGASVDRQFFYSPLGDIGGEDIYSGTAINIAEATIDNLNINGNTITATGDLILTASGDIDADSNKIINVAEPTSAQDAATKNYVDTQSGGGYWSKTGTTISPVTADDSLDMGGGNLTATNLTDGLAWIENGEIHGASNAGWDAAVLHISSTGSDHSFIDQSVTTAAEPTFAGVNIDNLYINGGTITSSADLILSPTSDVDLDTNKIINLVDPTSAQDAATKAYVDGAVGSQYWSRAVTTLSPSTTGDDLDMGTGTVTATTLTDGTASITAGVASGLLELSLDNLNLNGGTITSSGDLILTSSGDIDFDSNNLINGGSIEYTIRKPLAYDTSSATKWYKLGSLTGTGGTVRFVLTGHDYGLAVYDGVVTAVFGIGNADDEFGGSYWKYGRAVDGVSFEWVKTASQTIDCYVQIGAYNRGTIDVVEGYQFTVNPTAMTPVSDPSGTDLEHKMYINSPIQTTSTLTANTLTDGTASITSGVGSSFTEFGVDNLNFNGNTITSTGNLILTSSGDIDFDSNNLINGATVTANKFIVSGGNLAISTASSVITTGLADGTNLKIRNSGNTGYRGIDVQQLAIGGTEVVDSSRNIANVGTLTATTLTDGTASITNGAISGVTTLSMSGDLTVDTDTLFVDSTNNMVGIGTTSPLDELHIKNTASESVVTIESTAAASDAKVQFSKAVDSGSTWAVGLDDSNSDALGIAYNSAGDPSLTTNNLVTIDTSGHVGIGTASPSTLLHIENPTISNTIQDQLRLQCHTNSGGYGSGIQFRNRWNSGDYWTTARIYAIEEAGYGGQLVFETNLGDGSADDTTNEAMRIDENGNIGIGTAIPSALLDVDGAAEINGALDMTSHQINSVSDPTSDQDAATKAYVDAAMMIGSANSAWVPCTFTSDNQASRSAYWLGSGIGNAGSTDYYHSWICPLPAQRGGLNLYVKGIRITTSDADTSNYVSNAYVYYQTNGNSVNLNAWTTGDGMPINGIETDTHSFTGVSAGAGHTLFAWISAHATTTGALEIAAVELDCYYA